jgi:hypothetical protein
MAQSGHPARRVAVGERSDAVLRTAMATLLRMRDEGETWSPTPARPCRSGRPARSRRRAEGGLDPRLQLQRGQQGFRHHLDRGRFHQLHQGPAAGDQGHQDAFAGIKSEQEINDLIAYLKSFDENGQTKQ